MVALFLSVALVVAKAAETAEVDVREIVRRTVAADERNWQAARRYEFTERVDARRLDGEGRVKTRDVNSYEVLLLAGTPYRRLSARDDQPLAASEEKKEAAKLTRSIAERGKESVGQRALRLAAYEGRSDWQRDGWRELPEAFDFVMTGREARDGQVLYVIEATPRRGYQAQSRTAKVFAHLHGKLWVDAEDYRLVKAEVEVVETIAVGLILVRLIKGSRATFEQARVNGQVWLPRRVQVSASARVGLLKVLRIEQEVLYSKGREVVGEALVVSRLVTGGGK
jgi:hypothetical protein